jgi:hypothetical protein
MLTKKLSGAVANPPFLQLLDVVKPLGSRVQLFERLICNSPSGNTFQNQLKQMDKAESFSRQLSLFLKNPGACFRVDLSSLNSPGKFV